VEKVFKDYHQNPSTLDNIISPRYHDLINQRLAAFEYDAKEAKKFLQNAPNYIDASKKIIQFFYPVFYIFIIEKNFYKGMLSKLRIWKHLTTGLKNIF